ncbi:hypothetical protein [Synechococcus sp. BS56D]|uniref:hypothetical protein n=1 Tax=Synechococcus sp. BS56D TaxID=2055944 RepID=UPI00103AA237|nr:hypothetical protein [Synechococcus sp. BS56D]
MSDLSSEQLVVVPGIGQVIAGSRFLGLGESKPRPGRPGQSLVTWRMECGICNTEFIVNRHEIKNLHKNGKKRYCANTHLHSGVTLGQRFTGTIVKGWVKTKEVDKKTGVHLKDHKGVLRYRWLCECKCDCGTNHLARPDQLLKGSIKSCGCRRAEISRELHTIHGMASRGAKSWEYQIWSRASSRASQGGYGFDLSPEEIVIPKFCPILGIEINEEMDINRENAPSLDKFYPDKGYLRGQVFVTSMMANRLKSDATPAEMRAIADWLAKEEDRIRTTGLYEKLRRLPPFETPPPGSKRNMSGLIATKQYKLWQNSRSRARKAMIPHTLLPQDIVIPDKCPVLGIPIDHNTKGTGKGFKEFGASIDRIIPELGYCPGNICIMSGRANRLKKEADAKTWRIIADWATRVDNEIKQLGYAVGAIGSPI